MKHCYLYHLWAGCILWAALSSTTLAAHTPEILNVPVDTKAAAGIGFEYLKGQTVYDLKVNLTVTAPTILKTSKVYQQSGRVIFAPPECKTPGATHPYVAAGVKPNYGHAAIFSGTFLQGGDAAVGGVGGFNTYLSDIDIDVDSNNDGTAATKRAPDGSDYEDVAEYVKGTSAPATSTGLRAAEDDVIAVRVKINKKTAGTLAVTGDPQITFYSDKACATAAQWNVDTAAGASGQTLYMKVAANAVITAKFTADARYATVSPDAIDKVRIIKETGAVTFSPNPIITGYSLPANTSTIKRTVTAKVTPAADADDITFHVEQEGTTQRIRHNNNQITVTSANTNTGIVKFDVFGIEATPANKPLGDTKIVAKKNGTAIQGAEVQVIVSIPTTRINRMPTNDTWLNFTGPVVNNSIDLKTFLFRDVKITIMDQFSNTIPAIYDGAQKVHEAFVAKANTNRPSSNGFIAIPTGELSSGVVFDRTGSLHTVSIPLKPQDDVNALKAAWAAFNAPLKANPHIDNALTFELFNNNRLGVLIHGTVALKVHDHPVTPDYEKKYAIVADGQQARLYRVAEAYEREVD